MYLAVSYGSTAHSKQTLIAFTDTRHPNTWVKWVYGFIRYFPIFHEGYVIIVSHHEEAKNLVIGASRH